MSWTTSSYWLTLLSYATFNYHIHIHNNSDCTWRQHQWKQTETMVALASLVTEWQEALSEGQFGKQMRNTYFVWSWRLGTKCWYWSLDILGTLLISSWDIFFENEI